MALKQKADFASTVGNIMQSNKQKKEESRVVAPAPKVVAPISDLDEEEIRKRIEKELKKKTRTMQRSLKLDKHVNDWLDNVKKYQKETLGIVRPCLDDLMYDAITEYLSNHYMELEP